MPNNDSNKPEMVRIELIPLGAILEVQRGMPLQNLLSSHGMEFPCGGIGNCGGCRVQILEGHVEPTPEEQAILSHDELLDGWRMACYLRAESSMKLKIEQWTMSILVDDTQLARTRRQGLAIAIDLGTTTIAAQLLDLASGKLLGIRNAHRTAINSLALSADGNTLWAGSESGEQGIVRAWDIRVETRSASSYKIRSILYRKRARPG